MVMKEKILKKISVYSLSLVQIKEITLQAYIDLGITSLNEGA